MKKILATILALTLLCSAVGSSFFAFANFNDQMEAVGDLRSEIFYVINLDDGLEIFSKNADKPTPPATFVKILGVVTALDTWENLDETVEVTSESLSLVSYGYGVRTANLSAGETYTRRQLIEALLIYSANDVASLIAYDISGSADEFIALMNEKAAEIGLENTHVVNLTGFDAEGQHTTAKDVAKLIQYGLNSPAFTETFSAKQVTLPATGSNGERTYPADNKMMNSSISDYYVNAVNGGKQTSTKEAGECVAVTSSLDGYSYLTVVMQGKMEDVDKDGVNENTSLTDAKQLLSWIYGNIRYRVVATTSQTVSVLNVIGGRNSDTLRLVPEKETTALVPAKANNNSVLIKPIPETVPSKIKAPVKAGTVICQAKIYYADKEIATVNLVAANDVRRSPIRMFMTHLRSLLSSTPFILLELAALIGIVVYLVLFVKKYRNKKHPPLKRVPAAPQQNNQRPPRR